MSPHTGYCVRKYTQNILWVTESLCEEIKQNRVNAWNETNESHLENSLEKKLNNIDWFSWWKVCIQPKFIVYNDETDDGDTKRRIMLDRAGDKSKWEWHFWLLAREIENVCVTKSKREFQHFKWHVFCCHHCWFITLLSLTKAREWAWHIHSPTLYYESPQHLCHK